LLSQEGVLTYASDGLKEEGKWREGERHGLCRLVSLGGTSREETSFQNGIPDGPANVQGLNGAKEHFSHVNGVREGPARLNLPSGDVIEYNYEAGVMRGEWKRQNVDGSKELAHLEEGLRQGKATIFASNGDKLEFNYQNGTRSGPATYHFQDGSLEEFTYDQHGRENGACCFRWANGAMREGLKVDGKWQGEVIYTYGEGPAKGRKDKECWSEGQLGQSRKMYKSERGQEEKHHGWEVETWEDLEKMEDLTKDFVSF